MRVLVPLVPKLAHWLPVNSCIRDVLHAAPPSCFSHIEAVERCMQRHAHTSLRLEYKRTTDRLEYTVREQYWNKQAMTVEATLIMRSADKKTLEEVAIISSSAHLHYSVHLDEQQPFTYTGTLCNVSRLWKPPISRFVNNWFSHHKA